MLPVWFSNLHYERRTHFFITILNFSVFVSDLKLINHLCVYSVFIVNKFNWFKYARINRFTACSTCIFAAGQGQGRFADSFSIDLGLYLALLAGGFCHNIDRLGRRCTFPDSHLEDERTTLFCMATSGRRTSRGSL